MKSSGAEAGLQWQIPQPFAWSHEHWGAVRHDRCEPGHCALPLEPPPSIEAQAAMPARQTASTTASALMARGG